MARLKTAYRTKSEDAELNSAEDSDAEIPADYLLPDEDSLHREPESPPAPVAPTQPENEPTDASDALRAQVEAARRAEAINAHRQELAANETRRVEWLKTNPLAQANYPLLAGLHDEVLRSGIADLGDGYFEAMEAALAALEQPQSDGEAMDEPMPVERPAATAPAETPTPKFFQPPPVRMPTPRSVMVSAPVSRRVPTADRDRETNPNRVKLSAAQREAAKIAGVDEPTYARGLIVIEQEKRDGRRQS